jgi:hypothetical protein
MSTIVTRAGKGSPLTHNEVDANFTNLNTDKIQSGNTVAALTITSATISGGTITGITDLAIADGGTGASTAANARTNLGLGTAATTASTDYATAAQGTKADTALQPAAIGTTVQAYDADLTAWGAITPSTKQDTLVSGTSIKTINSTSLLGSGNIAIDTTPADGSITTAKIANNAITPAKMANSGSEFGMRNRIINGSMSINQRGTTLSTNNSQGYYLDRMWGFSGASTASTFTQGSSSGLTGFPFFARAQRTVGSTGTAGTYTGQIIESNNLQDLQGQSVTLSFWARAGANYSAASSALGLTLRTGTTADQGLNQLIAGWAGNSDQNQTVTLTTSWQYFNKTFTVASNVQEITYFFNGTGVGTAGANDYYDITGVQLEKGTTATSFDYRPYGTELQLCQRYYQTVGYGVATLPVIVAGYSASSSSVGQVIHKVSMRAAPTFSVTGSLEGLDNTLGPVTITATLSTASVDNTRLTLAHATLTSNAAREYRTVNTTSSINLSAEL